LPPKKPRVRLWGFVYCQGWAQNKRRGKTGFIFRPGGGGFLERAPGGKKSPGTSVSLGTPPPKRGGGPGGEQEGGKKTKPRRKKNMGFFRLENGGGGGGGPGRQIQTRTKPGGEGGQGGGRAQGAPQTKRGFFSRWAGLRDLVPWGDSGETGRGFPQGT